MLHTWLLYWISLLTIANGLICNLCTENVCSKCEGDWCISSRKGPISKEWCSSGFQVEKGCFQIGNTIDCAHNQANSDIDIVRDVRIHTCYDIYSSLPCEGQQCYMAVTSQALSIVSTIRGCTKLPQLLVPQSLFPGLITNTDSCTKIEFMRTNVRGLLEPVTTEECSCSSTLCNQNRRLVCQGLEAGCSYNNHIGKGVLCHQGHCDQGLDCKPIAQCYGDVCAIIRVTSVGNRGYTWMRNISGVAFHPPIPALFQNITKFTRTIYTTHH